MVCVIAICLSSSGFASAARAQDDWESFLISYQCKVEPVYYNSQRLALDRRGRPHVIYVTQTGNTDSLHYAHLTETEWKYEKIYDMEHTGRVPSGLSGYALALDRRSSPHVYVYSSNYRPPDAVFEERRLYREGRIWRNRVIRSSANGMGGAAMHDPHLAIDSQLRMHVTAYVHSGYGTDHRARHRFFDGNEFQILPFPRPPGKSDSRPSNLVIDRRDVVHLVYDSKKALRRGNAEPGYPDSSLVYVTSRGGRWSKPEIIRPRVGPDPNDTKYFVLSVGLTIDGRGTPHIVYATSKQKTGDPTDIYYVYRNRGGWFEQHVTSIPAMEGKSFRTAVFNPALDREGNPHFAFDHPNGSTYAYRDGDEWVTIDLEGDLDGFAMDARRGVHLLTRSGTNLKHHFRSFR